MPNPTQEPLVDLNLEQKGGKRDQEVGIGGVVEEGGEEFQAWPRSGLATCWRVIWGPKETLPRCHGHPRVDGAS